MRVTRTDLIERLGYDTKYASHVIRLGLQGIELLETGKLTIPLQTTPVKILLDIRAGKWTFDEVMRTIGNLETRLKDLVKDSPVQSLPNLDVVEEWMRETYWGTWKARKAFHKLSLFTEEERETFVF